MLNSFMTMATFSSWNSIKKAHHVDFVASRTWQILQVVMHGEESQVPGDLRQSEILIEQDFKICCLISNKLFENPGLS